jgi:short-subunit dehydrogenase involved in D-alanine esterification of teichoic acids
MFCSDSSIYRPGLFNHKVAIVTGYYFRHGMNSIVCLRRGGTGIGLQIARELLDLGCTVIIASRKSEQIAAAVKILENPRLWGTTCNIRQEDQVSTLCKA